MCPACCRIGFGNLVYCQRFQNSVVLFVCGETDDGGPGFCLCIHIVLCAWFSASFFLGVNHLPRCPENHVLCHHMPNQTSLFHFTVAKRGSWYSVHICWSLGRRFGTFLFSYNCSELVKYFFMQLFEKHHFSSEVRIPRQITCFWLWHIN